MVLVTLLLVLVEVLVHIVEVDCFDINFVNIRVARVARRHTDKTLLVNVWVVFAGDATLEVLLVITQRVAYVKSVFLQLHFQVDAATIKRSRQHAMIVVLYYKVRRFWLLTKRCGRTLERQTLEALVDDAQNSPLAFVLEDEKSQSVKIGLVAEENVFDSFHSGRMVDVPYSEAFLFR